MLKHIKKGVALPFPFDSSVRAPKTRETRLNSFLGFGDFLAFLMFASSIVPGF